MTTYKHTLALFILISITTFVYVFTDPKLKLSLVNQLKIVLNSQRNSSFFPVSAADKAKLKKCMAKNWAPWNTSHPRSPINLMPTGENLLLTLSYNATFCNPSKTNLRLIFVLSRMISFRNRRAIRNTYAAFEKYDKSLLLGNWSLFFIVAKSNNRTEQSWIENESREFGDIIAANFTEDYYNITFKTLIGLKVASCFCPKADYVIKTDDDTYIRIRKLDQVILAQQNLVDNGTKKDKDYAMESKLSNGHRRFFTGSVCSHNFPVYRGGAQAVSKENYPDDLYPFFCFGPLYFFRMATVHELAIDCPQHCTGQDHKDYQQNRKKYCLYSFEDVFIGSCVSFTQRNKTIRTDIGKNVGTYIDFPWRMRDSPGKEHFAVHKNRLPGRMNRTHNFYRTRNLAY